MKKHRVVMTVAVCLALAAWFGRGFFGVERRVEGDAQASPVSEEAGFNPAAPVEGIGIVEAENSGVPELKADKVEVQEKTGSQAKPPIQQPESGLKLIWIVPGSFTMGSPGTERGRQLGEGPQTVVMLDQGYWLAENATTVAQYASFGGRVPRMHGELNKFTNDPVVGVSWTQALECCRVLNEREAGAGRLPSGYIYRLPTEAEREYACRAGTTTYFSFGDDIGEFQLKTNEWYKANSEGATHPVRTKQPNPWGLYDMQGNAAEWCLDWLEEYPGGQVTNLVGTLNGRFHVLRGGAWSYSSDQCRCAARHRGMDSIRVMEAGFRIALAPEITASHSD